MKPLCLYLVMLLTAGETVAADTVHRWVDERGVVNYGDAPPRGTRATEVPTEDPLTVSTPPGTAPPAPAATKPSDVVDRAAVREEVERALRQDAADRAAAQQRADEEARLAAVRRCKEQRRVDCDAEAVTDDDVVYLPIRPPRHHHPHPPPQAEPVPPPPAAPPAYMKKPP